MDLAKSSLRQAECLSHLHLPILLMATVVAHAASGRDTTVPAPTAVATKADVNYCFDRVRGLDPGRLPPSYLALRLTVTVSYHNAGKRPLIVPMERERTLYTALKPGKMSVFKEKIGLFDAGFKPMEDLPADVSPDNPIEPKNDVFTVIPAGGDMAVPLTEEITLPVSRKGFFKHYPDLRGHRVYLKLQFAHRELSEALNAHLSDRWSKFGVPWTGVLTTNTILIDVPADPQAAPCKDIDTPAHPATGLEHMK